MDKAWKSPAVHDSALTQIDLGRVQLISEPRHQGEYCNEDAKSGYGPELSGLIVQKRGQFRKQYASPGFRVPPSKEYRTESPTAFVRRSSARSR